MICLLIGLIILLALVVLYGPQGPKPPTNGPWFTGDSSGW